MSNGVSNDGEDEGPSGCANADGAVDEPLAALAEEFARRHRRGERPSVEDYAREHPALAAQVRDLFPAIVLMEQSGVGPAAGGADAAAAAAAARVGATIGRYRLVERIGEGGFGVVFVAEQQHPVRRRVALKVIKPGMDTGQVIARFEAERQALAVMDHENVAKVFDAGMTETGRPYFVMELVPGVPITDYCERNRLTPRERLELFVRVCHAVQHAHTKGLIHRDLKPTNVLVMSQDDRPVPKVIDFGVAKATGPRSVGSSAFTQAAQMVGTPLYMSPEQAEMGGADVDTRSDVYGLGALLYELLTGTTPFDRARLAVAPLDEVRRIIREEEPPKPSTRLGTMPAAADDLRARRRLAAGLRGDLDWIVMRALEKDRSRRYESAVAMGRDVERHLRDEPVAARPPSTWYRFRKLARRRRAALAVGSALGAGALLAVAVLAISTLLLKRSLGREQDESYLQRIAVAHRDLMAGDSLPNALKLLDACPPDLRKWEWDYLARLCRVEPLVLRDVGGVASIAFSPDGTRLVSGGADGALRIWNGRTGEAIHTIKGHPGWVFSVAFHPKGTHVASVGADRRVKVWDLATDGEVFSGPCDASHMLGSSYTVAFSADGSRVAAGGGGALKVWDWRSGEPVRDLPTGAQRAPAVAFSPDGRHLATGTWQGSVNLWDADKGVVPLRTLTQDPYPVTALAFSPDGERLAQASVGRRVNVWSTRTGALLHELAHTGMVACVAFSPDGARVASGGEDKTVHLWDPDSGREVLALRGHTGPCICVTFSPDGRRLASCSTDGTIRIWDATPLRDAEWKPAMTFAAHDNEVWRVAMSPDGRRIASGGFRMPVQVWEAATGRVLGQFNGHPFVSFDLAWHPDGARLASAGWDGRLFSVRVWNPATNVEAYTIESPTEIFAVAFSPDGRYLVTAGMNRSIQVWDAATGKAVGMLGTHNRDIIRGITFSADGRSLASADGAGDVRLWDATRLTVLQKPRLTLRGRVPGQCLNLAFSSDGERLATGGEDNTVKIWDVQTGREVQTLRDHKANVYTVAFSPGGGRWVASGSEDGTVKVWDTTTGRHWTFRGHSALVASVAFSPDGHWLYSGSRDHAVMGWDLTPHLAAPSVAAATRAAQ